MTALGTATLYELASMRELLDERLAQSDGELTPALEAELDALDGAATEKLERVALYIREQLAAAEGVRLEEQRLTAKRKAHERRAEHLKRYLDLQMTRLGKTRVDGLLVTIARQRNSAPTIECIADAKAVLDGPQGDLFAERIETVEYRLRRDVVIRAWQNGDPLPAGVTVTLGSHIRIR